MRILIAEDDQVLADGLLRSLRASGCAADQVSSGTEADAALASHEFDLLILDLGLPRMHGLEVLRRLRARGSAVPVLILTAADSIEERVKGLDLGADDYMAKPFEPRELVARIQNVLRRAAAAEAPSAMPAMHDVVRFDGWELHSAERHLLSPAGTVIPLSNAEFKLLCTFLSMPRRVCSRDQLMERARGRAMESFERSIDLLVSRLRHKLSDDPRAPVLIKTVRGVGYLFNIQSVQGRAAWQH